MRMAAWHESGEQVKRCMIPYCPGDREVIALPENNAPAHEIRDLGEFRKHRRYRVDPELRKGLFDI